MATKRLLPVSGGGFSYVEMLAALVLTAMLLAGLTRIVGNVLQLEQSTHATHAALEDARYGLERMVRAVSKSRRLMIPQAENPATSHSESIRIPGVLAVTLDWERDLDGDGVPDADNDGDGRFDEDASGDANNDGYAGIYLIDDDNDGDTDPWGNWNDDESGSTNDDPLDQADNDGDGAQDEDPSWDFNEDGAPGIAGFDDDGDGSIDEGHDSDDDEDGVYSEDWWDTVLFYQVGTSLKERIPVPWDEDLGGFVSGLDFVERSLVENVAAFRVERVPAPNGGPPLISLTLTVTDAEGVPSTLATTVRVGDGV